MTTQRHAHTQTARPGARLRGYTLYPLTPVADPEARATYERLVPRLWRLLELPPGIGGPGQSETTASPDAPDCDIGLALTRAVMDAAEALARELDEADQSALLLALGEPFTEEPGPVEPDCRCVACWAARKDHLTERAVPRCERLREAVVQELIRHAVAVLSWPSAYDWGLGAPVPPGWSADPSRAAHRYDWHPEGHPWEGRPRDRKGYEAVVRRAWALARRVLPGGGDRERPYLRKEVEPAVDAAVGHLAYAELPLEAQAAFVRLVSGRAPACACGPAIAAGGRCPDCTAQRFAEALGREMDLGFQHGRERNRALGAPARLRPPAETAVGRGTALVDANGEVWW